MTKAVSLAIAGLLLVAANSAVAQTYPDVPRVKLQLSLDYFEGETKTGSMPFFFSLRLNQKGILRVEAGPARATTSESCTGAIPGQFLGTQVESTVAPTADGRFGVNLVFSERARAGCRDVGGLSIPVL